MIEVRWETKSSVGKGSDLQVVLFIHDIILVNNFNIL